MIFTTKTLAATTAALIALSAPAFAAGHEFDVNSARLDMTLDTNGDFDVEAARLDVANDLDGSGDVSDAEIIRANEMAFDVNGDGTLDAEEQGLAEQLLENS